MSEGARSAVYHALLAQSKDGKLPWGTVKNVASMFRIHRNTVGTIWKRAQEAGSAEEVREAIKNKKKGSVGRKTTDISSVQAALKALPYRRRRTYRHAERALGVAKAILHRAVALGRLDHL